MVEADHVLGLDLVAAHTSIQSAIAGFPAQAAC